MPNPISQVRREAGVWIGNAGEYPLSAHPELSLLAMEGIASWSNVEVFLLGFYITLAGGSSTDAAAIYLSLETSSAKTQAIATLARRRLSGDHQRLLAAILSVAKSRQADRDKLAHWVWGSSPDIPDGLLLADPRYLAAMDISSPDIHRELRENVFVYKEADFRGIIAANERLCGYALLFRFILTDHISNREGELFAKLSAEPEIADRLRRQDQRG